MPFWTEHTFQPKRTSRFQVNLRLVDAVNGCEKEPKIREIKWYNVVSAEKPSFNMQVSKIKYLNTQVRFAQPPTWNPIRVVILDIVDSEILQIIKDSQNEYMYKKTNYKLLSAPVDSWAGSNEVDIYQLDENGRKVEHWFLNKAFITNIRQSNLDYNQESLSTIEFTFEYDDAELIAKPEFIVDPNFVGPPTKEIFEGSTNYKPEVENEKCDDNLKDCKLPEYVPPPVEVDEPDKPAEAPLPDNITALSDVLFGFNKSDIKQEYYDTLDEIAQRLIKTGEKVDITGNTDKIGSDKYNEKLSQDRANAIMEYLLAAGVNEDQITATGAGERNANQSKNVTDEQRAQDRNVKFSFSGGEEENLDLPEGSFRPGDESIPPNDTGSVTGFENTEVPQGSGEGIERREPESTLQPTGPENAAQQSLIETEGQSFVSESEGATEQAKEENTISPVYSGSDIERREPENTLQPTEPESAAQQTPIEVQGQSSVSESEGTTEQAKEENTISPVYSGSDIERAEAENYLQSTSIDEPEGAAQQTLIETEGQSFVPETDSQTTSDVLTDPAGRKIPQNLSNSPQEIAQSDTANAIYDFLFVNQSTINHGDANNNTDYDSLFVDESTINHGDANNNTDTDSSFYLPEGVTTYDSTKEIPSGHPYSDVQLKEGQTLVVGEPSAVLEFVDANQTQSNISYNLQADPTNNLALPSYVIAETPKPPEIK